MCICCIKIVLRTEKKDLGFWKKLSIMILKKVYILRGEGGGQGQFGKCLHFELFFFWMASLRSRSRRWCWSWHLCRIRSTGRCSQYCRQGEARDRGGAGAAGCCGGVGAPRWRAHTRATVRSTRRRRWGDSTWRSGPGSRPAGRQAAWPPPAGRFTKKIITRFSYFKMWVKVPQFCSNTAQKGVNILQNVTFCSKGRASKLSFGSPGLGSWVKARMCPYVLYFVSRMICWKRFCWASSSLAAFWPPKHIGPFKAPWIKALIDQVSWFMLYWIPIIKCFYPILNHWFEWNPGLHGFNLSLALILDLNWDDTIKSCTHVSDKPCSRIIGQWNPSPWFTPNHWFKELCRRAIDNLLNEIAQKHGINGIQHGQCSKPKVLCYY